MSLNEKGVSVIGEFKMIKAQVKRVVALENKGDDYWQAREDFVLNLREYLRSQRFTDLPKKQFIELCCLVSSYRPCEPHVFLTYISIQIDKVE